MRKPDDAQYRDIIVEDLDHSILVEAGAGSGKTRSIISRMLALIGSGKSTVATMSAVTFTRKAAGELKGRFQVDLENAAREEKDDDRRERYQAALANLDLLFTGTIHSFCGRLLLERPIEAKLDPEFEELEEEEDNILRDRCWSEYLERLHLEGASALKKVIDLGLEPRHLLNTYQSVALYPEVEVVHEQLDPPDFRKDRTLLKKYLAQAWKALPSKVPDNGWDSLQRVLRRAWLRMRHFDLNVDRNFIRILEGLDRSGKVTQNRWESKEIAKEQQAAFDAFKEEVVGPCLDRWRMYCHYFIMELVIPGVAYFRSVRERHSLMNFQDLLLKAAELLRDNSEVRRYFQKRFTHMLVDEFQDTDPIQAEVILYLTGENVKEKSWQKLTVKPGALFVVGDPKQSIYRFRRADIDTFNEVKRIIHDSGGRIIPLTANFRSLPRICEWVNPIFKNKFPATANQFQPAFEHLDPYKKAKGGGVRTITIDKVPRNRQSVVAEEDAERIASWIHSAIRGDYEIIRTAEELKEGKSATPQPEDFMIIVRYKEHLSVYAGALEARAIPYEISGGGAFGESEEVWHLLNLLRAVAEPEDGVALVATLRGIFYGISDDMLYRFRRGGGRFSYLMPQDECHDAEAREKIGAIFAELKQFHNWASKEPPGTALALILDHLGIVPLALTREMGETRAGNLLKALELAFSESQHSVTSFSELVERLSQYYEEIEVEGMSVEPGKTHAVRLMNLHKAKGLEAPVIFLADPLKDTSHEPELHISRTKDRAVGYFLASSARTTYGKEVVGVPPQWTDYQELEEKYQAAEADRLLYVATTRAKQLLVVSRYLEKPDKGAWKDLYPYLDDAPELEKPTVKVAPEAARKVTSQVFEKAKEDIVAKIGGVKSGSYETESVTDFVKATSTEAPFSQDTGRGMSWGRIIHRMLQALAKEEAADLELMAENLLKEEERPLSEKQVLVETVNGVTSSDLWKRMKAAEQALVEVPFSIKTEDGEMPKLVSGTIDLIFGEPEGWVLADYKTDKVDGNLDALVAHYTPQVAIYRKFWEEISGEKVKEAGLYFIDSSSWVIV